jgi:uncharacterized protein YodC (DUF2158 family)
MEAGEKFKAGDVVRLKSGGPWMTIDHYGTFAGRDGWLCKWFSKDVEQSGVFKEDLLELRPDRAPHSFGGTVGPREGGSWMAY